MSPGVFLKTAASMKEGAQLRTNDFQLNRSYEETDSIVLQIPHGYVPEGTLPSASYSAAFGSYRIHSEFAGDSLVLTCRFRQYKGTYPADTWPKMVHFFNLIHREGDRQLFFVKP